MWSWVYQFVPSWTQSSKKRGKLLYFFPFIVLCRIVLFSLRRFSFKSEFQSINALPTSHLVEWFPTNSSKWAKIGLPGFVKLTFLGFRNAKIIHMYLQCAHTLKETLEVERRTMLFKRKCSKYGYFKSEAPYWYLWGTGRWNTIWVVL